MLAHFHYCNKGSQPFTEDWARSGNTSLAKLDSEQLQFLQETVEQIKEKGMLYASMILFNYPATDDRRTRRSLQVHQRQRHIRRRVFLCCSTLRVRLETKTHAMTFTHGIVRCLVV